MAVAGLPRPMLAPLVAISVLVAGCTVELPDATHPEDPGHAWTGTDSALWVARDLPCGFGSGADEGCATLTLLYRDGSVLRAAYGTGGPEQVEGYPQQEGDRRGLTFVFTDEEQAYADEVAAAWTAMHGADPDRVRVHSVDALRLDPTEREDVLRVVEHAVRQAEPLGERTFDCEDCASPVYWTFGSPAAYANQTFGQPPPGDRAWLLLEDQMGALHDWLDDQPG